MTNFMKILKKSGRPCIKCNSKELGFAYDMTDPEKPITIKCLNCGFSIPGSDNDLGAIKLWNAISYGFTRL